MLLNKLVALFGAAPFSKQCHPGDNRESEGSDTWTASRCTSSSTHDNEARIQPPDAQPNHTGEKEAQGGEKHPIFAHPENKPCILAVPAAALVDLEEAPGVFVILIRHKDADSTNPCLGFEVSMLAHPLFPNHRQKEWPCRGHDCDVRQNPRPAGAR